MVSPNIAENSHSPPPTLAPHLVGQWRSRLIVIEAAACLLLAKFLVRHVRLGLWRKSLGESEPITQSLLQVEMAAGKAAPGSSLAKSRRLARCVEKATSRAPGHTKCLPQAMALQWMMKRRSLPSRLFVAVLASRGEADLRKAQLPHDKRETPDISRSNEDIWHAWVEHEGQIIVGHCDRTLYRRVMVITQPLTISDA